MSRTAEDARRPRGQAIVVFLLALTGILLMVGVVIDGGYGLAQRRSAQNAADFAALAGARIVAENIGGDTVDGTDANVKAAIQTSLAVNGAAATTWGTPGDPIYVDSTGQTLGYVGSDSIPTGAVGVNVASKQSWRPFFIGIAGFNSLTASASATAKGGYYAGAPGPVFPAAIAESFFNGRSPCVGPVTGNLNGSGTCDPQQLSSGGQVSGGFGWVKFGCSGYGLGQDSDGCGNSKPFLQGEIDGNSYGCCTQVGLPGSKDKVGSLPGAKNSADCSTIINSGAVVTVAVWDTSGGSGSGAWFHIIGFTGFQITSCGKNLAGVWRQPMMLGPTTNVPGFAGAALGVELIR